MALPPGHDPRLREGANHHIGDQSFIEKFGRAPTSHDDERIRMTTHLQAVHDWLASRPATRPELAAKRAALLAAFEKYIAKGTTPKNADLPWRTPVFIDEEGTICAVGYLIESSVGRELPEKIAKKHRYDFIEDIAADMPEVRAWVAESGMTLEEIQTIQPAYEDSEVSSWRGWDLAKFRPKDGPSDRYGSGNFKGGNMDGEWNVYGGAERRGGALGTGVMKRGRGAWTSYYDTGEKLAEGRYVANQPEGPWKLFHKSGNLAAEGSFSEGMRSGKWRFYYDTAAKTPIAVGRFAGDGSVSGRWQHFDSEGKLLARSWTETPSQWNDDSLAVNGGEGSVLEVLPGPDGVAHAIHQGTPGKDVESNDYSLESFSKGRERLYIQSALGRETWFGADGTKLVHADDGTWSATNCHWSATRKVIAKQGDMARLDGVLSQDAVRRARALKGKQDYSMPEDPGPACKGEIEVTPERAKHLDELLASRDKIRSATPAFVRQMVLNQEDAMADDSGVTDEGDEANADATKEKLDTSDLARVLAGHMAMYIEWPHIDRRFKLVYATMAGRFAKHWWDRAGDTDGDVSYEAKND